MAVHGPVDRLARRPASPVVALVAALAFAGCASGGGVFSALDSAAGDCDAQYRELRELPPTPSGLSRAERSATRSARATITCPAAARPRPKSPSRSPRNPRVTAQIRDHHSILSLSVQRIAPPGFPVAGPPRTCQGAP